MELPSPRLLLRVRPLSDTPTIHDDDDDDDDDDALVYLFFHHNRSFGAIHRRRSTSTSEDPRQLRDVRSRRKRRESYKLLVILW